MALVLAALIANPICCCTIGSILDKPAGSDDSAPRHSCCSKKKSCPVEEEAPQGPGETPSCPCAMDNSIVLKAKLPHFDRSHALDSELGFPLSLEILPRGSFDPPCIAQRFDLPPPEAPWRLHCRYLL